MMESNHLNNINQKEKLFSEGVYLKVKSSLLEMGIVPPNDCEILFSPVDDFHKNVFFINFSGQEADTPILVMKILDNKLGWDVSEESIELEHDMGFYSSTLVPEIKPRIISGRTLKTESTPAVVFYDYLGEAATYVENPEQVYSIVKESLCVLQKLHFSTKSNYFGKSLDESSRSLEQYDNTWGYEAIRYLLNDIKSDNLDPEGEILAIIQEKWLPILDSTALFCLTHEDLTLSNILLKDGHINSFIDWTYSRWDDPARDIAYLAFWGAKFGKNKEVAELVNKSTFDYDVEGFRINETTLFFLAYKCLEYGRFKGKDWVETGKKILTLPNIAEALDLISKTGASDKRQ